MARAPKKPDEQTPPPADEPLEPAELGEADYIAPDLEFTQFIADYDVTQGGEIRVYREGPGGYRDLEFLQSYKMGEFEPPMLQQPPFCGGKFRIHVRSKGGFVRNFPFKCANLAPPAAPAPANDAGIAAVLAGIKELTAALAAPKQGMDIAETIKLIGALQGLGGAREPAPQVDPFAMLERLLTLRDKVAPPAPLPVNADGEVSDGTIMLEAIRTFGAPVAELIKRGANAPAPVQGAADAPALPNPANQPQPEPEDEMSMKMRLMKPVLLGMAQSGADPLGYVDMVLDMLTDEQIDKYLTGENWQTELIAIFPEARSILPWIEKLREGVKAALADDDLTAEPGGSSVAPGAVKKA